MEKNIIVKGLPKTHRMLSLKLMPYGEFSIVAHCPKKSVFLAKGTHKGLSTYILWGSGVFNAVAPTYLLNGFGLFGDRAPTTDAHFNVIDYIANAYISTIFKTLGSSKDIYWKILYNGPNGIIPIIQEYGGPIIMFEVGIGEDIEDYNNKIIQNIISSLASDDIENKLNSNNSLFNVLEYSLYVKRNNLLEFVDKNQKIECIVSELCRQDPNNVVYVHNPMGIGLLSTLIRDKNLQWTTSFIVPDDLNTVKVLSLTRKFISTNFKYPPRVELDNRTIHLKYDTKKFLKYHSESPVNLGLKHGVYRTEFGVKYDLTRIINEICNSSKLVANTSEDVKINISKLYWSIPLILLVIFGSVGLFIEYF